MAQKTYKSKMNLNVNLKKLAKPVNLTIANININDNAKDKLSSEGAEVMNNPNASERFKILYRSGVNPLKAVLIANTEFVPVATGRQPADVSTLNLNFGEQSSISVTNCARLIEIHQQIRSFTFNTARKILNTNLGYDADHLYRTLSHILGISNGYSGVFAYRIYWSSEIDDKNPTIEKTVRNLIKRLEGYPTFIRVRVASRKPNKRSPALMTSIPLSELVRREKNNPMFKAMLEYMIYDSVIEEAIRYFGGLLRLKEDLSSNYSLSEMSVKTTDIKSFGFESPTLNKIFKIKGDGDNVRPHFGIFSKRGNAMKSTGVKVIGGNEIDEILNVLTSLARKILLVDTVDTLLTTTYPENRVEIETGKVVKQLHGNLGSAFDKLSAISYEALYPPSQRKVSLQSANVFSEETIGDIESNFSKKNYASEQSLGNIYAEMLSAICFDSVYELTGRSRIKLKLPTALARAGINTNTNLLRPITGSKTGTVDIRRYLRYALGSLCPTHTARGVVQKGEIVEDYPQIHARGGLLNFDNFGALGAFFARAVKKVGGDYHYLPFVASYGKIQKPTGVQSYLTGPEHFIETALQESDFEFKDFKEFTDAYNEVIEAFVEDILTLTMVTRDVLGTDATDGLSINPLGALSPVEMAKSLCYEFGTDMGRNIGRDSAAIHLALTSHLALQGPYYRAQGFKASFTGMMSSPLFFNRAYNASKRNFSDRTNLYKQSSYASVTNSLYHTEKVFLGFFKRIRVNGLFKGVHRHPNNGGKTFTTILKSQHPFLTTKKNMAANPKMQWFYGRNEEQAVPHFTAGNATNIYRIYWDSGDTDLLRTMNFGTEYASLDSAIEAVRDASRHETATETLQTAGVSSFGVQQLEREDDNNEVEAITASSAETASLAKIIRAGATNATNSKLEANFEFRGPQFSYRASAFANFLLDNHMSYYYDVEVGSPSFEQYNRSNKISNVVGVEAYSDFNHDYNEVFYNSAVGDGGEKGQFLVEIGAQALPRNMRHGMKKGKRYKFHRNPRAYGPVLGLGIHHRAFVWWSFFSRVIAQSITIVHDGRKDKGYKQFGVSSEEIEGVKNAFRQVARAPIGQYTGGESEPAHQESTLYKTANRQARVYAHAICSKAKHRSEGIFDDCMILLTHAKNFKKYHQKFMQYVKSGDGSKQDQLMLNQLRRDDLYNKSLKLLSRESISNLYVSHLTRFSHDFVRPLYTYGDRLMLKPLKLMYKILSQESYGLLSKSDKENRGNKTVLHVGLTNSMLSILRREAFERTGNRSYLDSSRICINVFKKNQLNSYELLYPKTYVFDADVHVVDIPEKRTREKPYASHITDFKDSWNFRQIIDNMEFLKYTDEDTDASNTPHGYQRAFRPIVTKGPAAFGGNRDIAINHAFDYAFKYYYKALLGIDVTETNFIVGEDPIADYDSVAATKFAGQDRMTDLFNRITDATVKVYPAANIDPILSQEMFRALSTIKTNNLFGAKNNLKKVFSPKAFDRIFSILVNEKDFVIHEASVDKELHDIYKSVPSFEITSKLSRPDVIDDFTNSKGEIKLSQQDMNSNVNDIATVTTKYKASCFNDYPEVYTYYVSVSILP